MPTYPQARYLVFLIGLFCLLIFALDVLGKGADTPGWLIWLIVGIGLLFGGAAV